MNASNILLTYLSMFILGVLTVSGLLTDWTLGPLYARIELPFFHNAHAISMLTVPLSAFYLIAKSKGRIPLWTVGCLATASMHELSLAIVDLAAGSYGGFVHIAVSYPYAVWLGFFLFWALWKGIDFQRRILFAQLLLLMAFYVFDLAFNVGSSIYGLDPTPLFYNPFTNAVEVLSWVIPSLFWAFPRDWVEKWRLLSLRS